MDLTQDEVANGFWTPHLEGSLDVDELALAAEVHKSLGVVVRYFTRSGGLRPEFFRAKKPSLFSLPDNPSAGGKREKLARGDSMFKDLLGVIKLVRKAGGTLIEGKDKIDEFLFDLGSYSAKLKAVEEDKVGAKAARFRANQQRKIDKAQKEAERLEQHADSKFEFKYAGLQNIQQPHQSEEIERAAEEDTAAAAAARANTVAGQKAHALHMAAVAHLMGSEHGEFKESAAAGLHVSAPAVEQKGNMEDYDSDGVYDHATKTITTTLQRPISVPLGSVFKPVAKSASKRAASSTLEERVGKRVTPPPSPDATLAKSLKTMSMMQEFDGAIF